MKKQLLFLALLATVGVAKAQNTTSPSYTTNPSPIIDGTGNVTITWDLSQTALASPAFSGDVYMYTGIDIQSCATCTITPWAHVRRAWSDVSMDATYKLTPAGTNLYTYTFTNLRAFYALGADTMISTMNFVLRSTDGTMQAGDLKIPVNQGTATGITKISNDLSVSLSPNPVSDYLNLSYANGTKDKATYAVVNMLGETVITKSELVSASTRISLAELPTGIYFVKLQAGDQQITKKIVKQ